MPKPFEPLAKGGKETCSFPCGNMAHVHDWVGKLVKIEVDNDTGDVSFYFDNSDEPFSSKEFQDGSRTRRRLEAFESSIGWFNGPHWRDHP